MSARITVEDGEVRGMLLPAGEHTYLVVDDAMTVCGRLEMAADTELWAAYYASDVPTGMNDSDLSNLAVRHLTHIRRMSRQGGP